jgi:hypothetical protein
MHVADTGLVNQPAPPRLDQPVDGPERFQKRHPVRHRLRWILLAVCVALFAAAVIAADLAGGSIDPTDPANFNAFTLQNDTGRAVVVRLCESPTCTTFYDDGLNASPGGTIEEQVAWGGPTPQWFLVTDGRGHRVGCLALYAPTKRAGAQRIHLATARSCERGR